MRIFNSVFSLVLSGLLLTNGCKCQRSESQAKAYAPQKGPVIYASDKMEFEDIRDFYKRVFGTDTYTTNWAEIDKYRTGSAIPERKPYLDSWYPERTGGTNSGNALSKYDRAFNGGENKAAKWEVDNHNRPTPNWYGHCNGTSVASTRYQNPRNNVRRPKGCNPIGPNCVEFTTQDIRALLTEISMNARAKFISGNRCRLTAEEVAKRPALRSNPLEMDECDDVNPGSFHTGLVNFLGRMKQPIIFDERMNEEVWNYPIYRYSYTAEGPLNEGQAIAATGLPIDSWVFNSKAKSWYRVNMTVEFRMSRGDFTGAGTVPDLLETMNYDYILEIDEAGNVLGGEWLGASRTNHPDFIWMPFEPAEPTGDQSRGNAFINNQEVIKLWADSVGFDPSDPFRDKPKNTYDVRFFPPSDLSWGSVRGFYRLTLDGRSTGVAFLGKKTHMRVEVDDSLKSDATVEVTLNGQALPMNPTAEGRYDVLMDVQPGVNLLSFRWNSPRVDANEINWDFRFYAM